MLIKPCVHLRFSLKYNMSDTQPSAEVLKVARQIVQKQGEGITLSVDLVANMIQSGLFLEPLAQHQAALVRLIENDRFLTGKVSEMESRVNDDLARYKALYEHLTEMCQRNGLGDTLVTALPKVISQRDFALAAIDRAVKLSGSKKYTKVEDVVQELVWKLDHLLAHCKDSECSECAVIICPDQEDFHFHHDGCPICDAQEEHKRLEKEPVMFDLETGLGQPPATPSLAPAKTPYLDVTAGPGGKVTTSVMQP